MKDMPRKEENTRGEVLRPYFHLNSNQSSKDGGRAALHRWYLRCSSSTAWGSYVRKVLALDTRVMTCQ